LEDLMLRRLFTCLLLLAPTAAAAAAQAPAPPPPPPATARVAYFEVAPAEVKRVTTLLKDYRADTQKAAGIGRVQVLQQIGRPNFFAIEEEWQNPASLQAHQAAAATKKFRDDLQGALVSPYDERMLAPVTAQAASGALSDDSIYVLTHADSVPDRRDEAAGILKQLAEHARQETGNVLFDATLQPNRTNHFTLIEVWRDQKAYDGHETADNTKRFRAAFLPFSGALYDERLYRIIK
jgi:quinol monooxygenase YgiN